MRKMTVRSGLRFVAVGILCVMVSTFFHAQIARLLFLGIAGEASLTLMGFFLGGVCGGCGVLVAAVGLLQSRPEETPVRLAPMVLLIVFLVILFFALAYNSISVPQTPRLQPGESIDI